MSYREEALAFGCAGEVLIGVLSSPMPSEGATTPADVGVVIIVGGPQYRAGSHRQFTLLARALATAGYPVLRFDYRGMGDSTGPLRDFEAVNDDVAAAIDLLQQRQAAVTRLVLWGLCDGASAALLYLYAKRDPRVRGLALANPWVRSEVSQARTYVKSYYLNRLRQPEFWRKALSGRLAGSAATDLWRNLQRALGSTTGRSPQVAVDSLRPYQQRMAEAIAAFDGRLLLVTSGNDLTAKEFLAHAADDTAWQLALRRDRHHHCDFAQADHTFSGSEDLSALLQATVKWLRELSLQASHPPAVAVQADAIVRSHATGSQHG